MSSEQRRRLERLVRSTVLGSPFTLINRLTRYEVIGREHLETALSIRRREGCGMISVSNHLSLFDDPLIFVRLLGLSHFTVESKCWWSTPCESNFNPRGAGLGPRFVRYFSDVSKMVFFTRPSKQGLIIAPPKAYAPVLAQRGGPELMTRLAAQAAAVGLDVESLLGRYITAGSIRAKLAPLNQPGMIEACARVGLGDWLHFFPEGSRSRSLHLKPIKRGVGKVIYHHPDALLLPLCFYGSQDVLPTGAWLPRPFKRIVVTIGAPVRVRRLTRGAGRPSPDAFQRVIEAAWSEVTALRPLTLEAYLGARPAEELLRAEAEAARAEAALQPAVTRLPAANPSRPAAALM